MAAPHRRLFWLAALVTVTASTSAGARSRGLKATLAPESLTIDGEPREWDTDWRDLDHTVRGSPDKDDLSGRVTIAYDNNGIFVAADITDDKLVGGGDHVELLLGIPGGTVHSLTLYPGVPGKSRAVVKSAGRPVQNAEIVEAPTKAGYSLEAKIPWEAIPRSSTVRVGYRGAIFVHDSDARGVDAVMGTADTRKYAELPPISTEPELALGGGLLRERNLTHPPKRNLMANVSGDGLLERVLLYDRYLVVLGPGYRGGEQYYFRDLGGGVPELELADYTGDGRADIKLRKIVKNGGASAEVMEILSFHAGNDAPDAVFSQEVKLALSRGKIENELKLTGSGSRTRIVISAGHARGIDPTRFNYDSNTGATPVLLPWGTVAQQTFGLSQGTFVVVDEKKQAADTGPPPPPPELVASEPAPRATPRPTPRRASSSESERPDVERVYGLYKEQRNVRGAPRFDVKGDLADDGRTERLVVHGRDLVVFGEGYRGGRGFAAVTLSQFDKGSDIRSVSTRDVTGDGKHEIIVKGIIKSPLPSDVGEGEMERSVVMVYQLKGGNFDRVFAAEVARRIGDRKVTSNMRFVGDDRIELTPGKATGYNEDSYPWAQKKSADDGFEPLLLPWGGIDRVRLKWNGEQFAR